MLRIRLQEIVGQEIIVEKVGKLVTRIVIFWAAVMVYDLREPQYARLDKRGSFDGLGIDLFPLRDFLACAVTRPEESGPFGADLEPALTP